MPDSRLSGQKGTLLFAALFTLGNIVLPQLCHLVPNGGFMLLPIYFFTLIGAYLYGWQLGLAAAWVARRAQKVSIPLLVAVVLGYQLLGSMIESALVGSLAAGFQDFRIGLPGMLLQIVGGYTLIRWIASWK